MFFQNGINLLCCTCSFAFFSNSLYRGNMFKVKYLSPWVKFTLFEPPIFL